MFEDGIEGNGNVDPFCILRKQRPYDLMVALAPREYLPLTNDIHHLWREEGMRMVCDTYDDELHI